MSATETVLFLDTNSLLHYPPVTNVDWQAITGSPSVRLVLCMQVIHELDQKKNDPRLGERASRTIKDVKAIRSADGSVRNGVSLDVFNYEIHSADFPGSLSYDSPDDRIVHLVKKYLEGHPGVRVAVYTEDMGMSLRCEANGIEVVEPNAGIRLPNPQDELTKKYRQAISDLNALKNRLPAFTVRAMPAGTQDLQAENKYELFDSWQTRDPQAEVEKIKQALQPVSQPGARRLIAEMTMTLSALIPEEERKRYEQEIAAYFIDYERYVQQLNTWGENESRTIKFDLWLHNTGSSPAEDVDFLFKLPPRLAWVALSGTDAASVLDRPAPPQPPEKPRPRYPFESFADLAQLRNRSPLPAQLMRMLAERDTDKVEVHHLLPAARPMAA